MLKTGIRGAICLSTMLLPELASATATGGQPAEITVPELPAGAAPLVVAGIVLLVLAIRRARKSRGRRRESYDE
jgi:hypothetical protein